MAKHDHEEAYEISLLKKETISRMIKSWNRFLQKANRVMHSLLSVYYSITYHIPIKHTISESKH